MTSNHLLLETRKRGMCQDETIPNLQARITQITRIYILVLYPRKYKLSAKFAKSVPKYIF